MKFSTLSLFKRTLTLAGRSHSCLYKKVGSGGSWDVWNLLHWWWWWLIVVGVVVAAAAVADAGAGAGAAALRLSPPLDLWDDKNCKIGYLVISLDCTFHPPQTTGI